MKTPVILATTILLGLILAGCNRNHNEPPLETTLPIHAAFVPTQVWIDKSDTDLREEIEPLYDKLFVINSVDELPDDPFGFSDPYVKADFDNYTMLVYYHLHRWEMESYSYWFYRQNREHQFVWTITNNIGVNLDPYPDKRQFTRYAVLVSKLPADADIIAGVVLRAYEWEPGQADSWD